MPTSGLPGQTVAPLFNDQCLGMGPAISFVANGYQHDVGYYLADRIYFRWPAFVKTIGCPTDPKKVYFAQRQEAARKDVERAFVVLQARWAVVKGPVQLFYDNCIADVMYACIIMHNMIVDNEGTELTNWRNEDAAGPSHGVAPAFIRMGVPHGDAERIQAFVMCHQQAHIQLQHDIIEELRAHRIAC